MQINSSINLLASKRVNELTNSVPQAKLNEEEGIAATSASTSVQISTDLEQLGRAFLGEEVLNDWQDKGLTITSAVFDGVLEAMNSGLRALEGNAGYVALNKHEIVMNNQETPEWFVKEKQDIIASHPNPKVRESFSNGDLFFAVQTASSTSSRAIAAYRNVMSE